MSVGEEGFVGCSRVRGEGGEFGFETVEGGGGGEEVVGCEDEGVSGCFGAGAEEGLGFLG